MTDPNADHNKPLIPPETKLPEITVKAVIISVLLAIVLGASDGYLALKVGVTVAASIPAAVVSMGILRFFKNSNVLESNLAQTAASAGEGIAVAAMFILPSLLIVGAWQKFNFLETTALMLLGGTLGVLFAVPLRRVLLSLPQLPFPEGTAIGVVLRARAAGGNQLKRLAQGGIVGALIALSQTGFKLVADHVPLWIKSGNTLFGINIGFDPVLLGAGYIIGIRACLAMFIGTVLCWIIGIPILCQLYGIPATGSVEDQVMSLWSNYLRYVGVGIMMVGGLWTLIMLARPIAKGLTEAVRQMRNMRSAKAPSIVRTEFDIPLHYVIWGLIVTFSLIFLLLVYFIGAGSLHFSWLMTFVMAAVSLICLMVLGFLSLIIGGYLVGLIGSTNTPLSGLLIINVLLLSLILFTLASIGVDLSVATNQRAIIAIVIFVLSMIGTAASITLENIQDLKAGKMVGATPWKQQLMMFIGVVVASVVITPVLQLLFEAYGIGGVMPRPGMDPAQMLPAPQSGLIAALTKGFISHSLPWDMLLTGCGIAVVFVVISEMLKRRVGYTLPVLAVGLGAYLPPQFITPTVLGGFISYLAGRAIYKRNQKRDEHGNSSQQQALLIACGLVAGAAIMGVILAIPFVIAGNTDILQLISSNYTVVTYVLGFVVVFALAFWLYRVAARKPE